MATDLTQSWFGKHVEKVVVGAAVLILAGAAVFFVVMRTSQEQRRVDLHRLVGQIEDRPVPTPPQVLAPEEWERLGLGKEPLTAEQFAARLNTLSSEQWPVGPSPIAVIWEGSGGNGGRQPDIVRKPPERVMPVEDVQVAVGRGVTDEPVAGALAKMADHGLSDIAWVGCVGKFDLTAQLEEYRKGEAAALDIIVTNVELMRRVRKPDGSWSGWASVPPVVGQALRGKIPDRPSNSRDTGTVGAWYLGLKKMQEQVRRMPLVNLQAVDREGKTVYDVAGDVRGLARPRSPRPEPKAAAGGPERMAAAYAPVEPRAPVDVTIPDWLRDAGPETTTAAPFPIPDVEPKHIYATVWAHDLSVRPGWTYQYKMRVSVFNPVYRDKDAVDEKAKWTLTYDGEWSEPTQPVRIPRLVQFYFVGMFGDKPNLELHRWIHGQWVIVPSVPFQLGQRIVHRKDRARLRVPGSNQEVAATVEMSPGVLLVDMVRNVPYKPGSRNRPIPTNVLVFSDLQGRLGERIEWEDKKNAANDRLARKGVLPAPPRQPGAPPSAAVLGAGLR